MYKVQFVIVVLALAVAGAGADTPVDVYVNEVKQYFGEHSALMRDDVTYVPLRDMVETLGGEMRVDQAQETVIVRLDDGLVDIAIAQGIVVEGRLLVPLRMLAEAGRAWLIWDAAEAAVHVNVPHRPLAGRKMAILVEEGFHDGELDVPRQAVQALGARTVLIGSEAGEVYEDYRGQEFLVTADLGADEARAADYHALLIPGGRAPGIMRENEDMLRLVRDFHEAGKPIAAICHGPWVVTAAGIAEGRKMTCVSGIADDLRAAGADYRDEPVVVDENLITSRVPRDLDHFNAAIIEALEAVR